MSPIDLTAFFPPTPDETAVALAQCLRLAAQRGRAIRAAAAEPRPAPLTGPTPTTAEAKMGRANRLARLSCAAIARAERARLRERREWHRLATWAIRQCARFIREGR